MPRIHEGFILFVMLIFLQVLALLSLFSFEQVLANLRDITFQASFQKIKSSSEIFLKHLERSDFALKLCNMPMTGVEERPTHWWREYACHDEANGIQFYYVIEDLGRDPCIWSDLIQGGHYYRITLIALPHSLKNAKIRLQSTVLKAEKTNILCKENLHSAVLGRQMFREI